LRIDVVEDKLAFGSIPQDFHEVFFDIVGKLEFFVAKVDNAIHIAAIVNQDIVDELVLVDNLEFVLWLRLKVCEGGRCGE
jgi:hypothetical protein